jgi:hypothetical protein
MSNNSSKTMTRQDIELELCRQLDDEALRLLALALKGVIDGPAGYGSVEILISDRRVTYVNFSTRMKATRE